MRRCLETNSCSTIGTPTDRARSCAGATAFATRQRAPGSPLEFGVSAGKLGDCQPVGEGVFELRIHFGAGYRVYFANDGDEIVLLLLGGDKSSQDKDIKEAKEYWADYGRRK